MPYTHQIRIRYGEVDRQGVAYNSHFLTYVDDTLENWLDGIREVRDQLGWDMMVKKASLEWQGPVGHADRLDIQAQVRHWGRSSWTVSYTGTHQGTPVFEAEVLYVSIQLPENTPIETPAPIREFMGEAVPLS